MSGRAIFIAALALTLPEPARGRQEGCHFDAKTQAAFLPVLRAELDRQGLRDTPIVASDETSFAHARQTWEAFDAPTRALRIRIPGQPDGDELRVKSK